MKRKILAFFLVGVFVLSVTMTSSASDDIFLLGDVNGDGKVDTADALEILKFVVKKESVFDDDEKGKYYAIDSIESDLKFIFDSNVNPIISVWQLEKN